LRLLLGLFGDMGSGKNIYMVWYVMRHYVQTGAYTAALPNFHIADGFLSQDGYQIAKSPVPERTPGLLDYEHFVALPAMTNALVLIDEAYLWLDSRSSSSKVNKRVSYLVLQSRKRGFDILYAAQVKSSVDLRLRDLSELWVFCERRDPCKEARKDLTKCQDPHTHGFHYTEEYRSMSRPVERERFFSNAKVFPLLPFFNTHEVVINPFEQGGDATEQSRRDELIAIKQRLARLEAKVGARKL
jgi:hypothetical protein